MKKDWSNQIGKKYGRLTIVEILPDVKPGDGTMCKCVCDCEAHTEVIVPLKRVIYSRKTSCGCHKGIDLLGKRFGRLVVIEKQNTRYRRQIEWKCLCDCGKEVVVPSDSLRQGRTQSCGCLGDETRLKNARGPRFNLVLGTNTSLISRSDSSLRPNNTSGYSGIYYDQKRKLYEVRLEFQSRRYQTRHASFDEAVMSRQEMKLIHLEFLEWWNGLDKSEQADNQAAYKKMVADKKALLEAHCDQYRRLNGSLKDGDNEDKNNEENVIILQEEYYD